MTGSIPNWHPHGRTLAEDLQILTQGGETGWWDEHGHPAPWPEDFLDPDAGWTSPDPETHTHIEPGAVHIDPSTQPF